LERREDFSSKAASSAAAASMLRQALTAAPRRGVPRGESASPRDRDVGDLATAADRASGLMEVRPRDLCDGVGDARGLEGVLALVMTGEGLPAPRLAGERVFAEAATIADSKVGGPTIESRPR
jgi:hypothetical protein